MITATISFTVAPGKNFEAAEYFQQVVRHVKKLTDVDARVLNQLGGPMGHFVLVSQYETLAAWDTARTKIARDTPFQKMVAEAGKDGIFLPGSVVSAIYQQV
jgi:quinol monooxygenase YgiN